MSFENDQIFLTSQGAYNQSEVPYVPNGIIPGWNQVAQPAAVPVANDTFSCYVNTSGAVYGDFYYANQDYGYHHSHYPASPYQDCLGYAQNNIVCPMQANNQDQPQIFSQAPSVQTPSVQRPNATKKPKRFRTAFTTNQLMFMENEFTKTPYITRDRRMELSHQINVHERAIKIWFQNRRMKKKIDANLVSSSSY